MDNRQLEQERTTTADEQETEDPMLYEKLEEEFLFREELFEPFATKTQIYRTRAEKKEHKRRWADQSKYTSRTMQLIADHEKDPEVQRWLHKEVPSRVKSTKEGLVVRLWSPRNAPITIHKQIVLPKQ